MIDEPTIVSSRQPTPCPAKSDSASRILEGHVMPGDRLGVFELVEYVGGGGMGRVYRARDTQLGRMVAIKVLPPEQAGEADAAQRFQNEAQSAARLDHENIARVYGVGEDRGLFYIIFEFVEGVNIRDLVERNGSLTLADALSYTLQTAEALAHADARSVVHRDIKPSNVLITPEGRVKLIDMGLARLRHVEPNAADLTASGVTLGTFDYISPEQARNPRNADVRSDIYSLGCTLFFMLTGRPPFPDGTVLQKLLQHQGDEPPDVRQLRPELPEGTTPLLRKMMAKEPERRYATPSELAGDLMRLADEAGLESVGPSSKVWWTATRPTVGFFRRHLPWMAPVAALVCVVFLLHVYWSLPSEGDVGAAPSTNVRAGQKAAVTAREKSDELDIRESQSRTIDLFEQAEPPLSGLEALLERATPQAGDSSRRHVTGAAEAPRRSDEYSIRGSSVGGESGLSPSHVAAGRYAKPDDRSPGGASRQPADVATTALGVLVVCDSPAGANEFSSLGAACSAAQDGDVIELRFNGSREERPIKVANRQLTIRAGEGYQPVVVFRPTEINPARYPRSMFTLTAGRLTLADVSVELQVPSDVPADNWSLLETWGGQVLRVERCWLSIRNATDQFTSYHPAAAMIRARPAPEADVAAEGVPAATPLATIELADCVARGEAAFLCVEDLQPVYLLWDNGLVATSDPFLIAGGGSVAPKPDGMLRLELRHVTAAVHGGLCRLGGPTANPYQLTVQFVCTDDIIFTSLGVPLIEQESTVSAEKSRERVLWNGDRNYYQNVDVFWQVRNADSEIVPDGMTFDAWKAFWGPSRESRASQEPLRWKRDPDSDRPLHDRTPADYALEDRAFVGAEAGPPGCRADRLPPAPRERLPGRASSTGSIRYRDEPLDRG
ncbi:MAG: serine/threonine-protein kinase [Thermoguttaceae bacterium]